MGLDTVEFVMALEQRFAVVISDRDAEGLTTPRRVVELLESRLGKSRTEIEKVVAAVMAEELGVVEFRWDQTWRELGVD